MKIKSRKKAEPKGITKTEAENSQLELFSVKQNIKTLQDREKQLKDVLTKYMDKAITPDSKGHRLFTTINAEGKKIHLQKQARKKISLNAERALAYLDGAKRNDLIKEEQVIASDVTQDQIIEILAKHAPEYLDTVRKPDEILLEQAVVSEEISMEDFESLCDINITYAMTYIDDSKLEK